MSTEGLWLRPVVKADLEKLRRWRNDYREFFWNSSVITKSEQEEWFNSYRKNTKDLTFIISTENGTEVGMVALFDIDRKNKIASIGRLIVLDQFSGHGYATKAVEILSEVAHLKFGITTFRAEPFLDNLRAISVWARAGFKVARQSIKLEKKI